MKQKHLLIFTRTPLHVGAGSAVGAIDQPIQRERHTGFPIIPGSSLKGVIADLYLERENGRVLKDERRQAPLREDKARALFGVGPAKKTLEEKEDQGQAGGLAFGEAQVLAFPVRSGMGCFSWVTCPLVLARWARLGGQSLQIPKMEKSEEGYFKAEVLGNPALLEDYSITCKGPFAEAEKLAKLPLDGLWTELAGQHLALISNDLFGHFVRNCCEVAQHVVIDDETGAAKQGLLFNQENLPADTLLLAPVYEIVPGSMDSLEVPPVLQFGGDATTGLGFCSVKLV